MHANISGFSPYQRVMGRNPPMPEHLLSEERLDAVYEGPSEAVRNAENLRLLATQAWATAQSRLRVMRAGRAKHRVPMQPLTVGLRVFVYRKTPRQKVGTWHGPGV
eukprot:6486930-Amphidinium_carterae.1